MERLDRFFAISERGSTPGTEIRAGVATFLTMAYILFVNPEILSAAGVPRASCMAATALAAALCSIAMGIVANFPLALASGMGLNAFLTYTVVLGLGASWQVGMGLVFIDGVIVLLLVFVGFRREVMRIIPIDLKRAIGGGIGLFIAFIGLVNARVVVVPGGTLSVLCNLSPGAPRPALPPVTTGELASIGMLVTLGSLILTVVLLARGVKGAISIGIAGGTILSLLLGMVEWPSTLPHPSFETIGALDLRGALSWSLVPYLVGFVIVDFFDTIGTVTAIGEQAELLDEAHEVPRIGRILGVDAASAIVGGLFGVSSVTAYIESAAGVAEGGRTGLSAVTAGVLFLLAILLAPLAALVPPEATAPALIVIGFLMMKTVTRIDFSEITSAFPAFVVFLTLPLTYSIAHGIGFGFITYALTALCTGKGRQVHPLLYLVSAIFLLTFLLVPLG
ncbi:MAG: NCS2 family permease [Deltaproteobacteria bacterium]|nr:MAG: NCS2 family permease [Deltaproteobacteria bacterium]